MTLCRAVRCSVQVPERVFFCARHGRLIPDEVRELPNDTGSEWVHRMAAAIEAIAIADGVDASEAPLVTFSARLRARERAEAAAEKDRAA